MNSPEIVFSGNVGAKPQLRLAGTSAVTSVRVAVTPRRKAAGSDEWEDGETLWFTVTAWRTTAANLVASLNPGDRVLVRGRLTQRTWKDAEGIERPSFEVDASDVGLDLARRPAMSVRLRAPEQRQDGEEPGDAGSEWRPAVDLDTGEVLEQAPAAV